MSCDEALELLQTASEGSLVPALAEHLSGCPSCREVEEALRVADVALTVLRAAGAAEAPPPFSPRLAAESRGAARRARWRGHARRALRPALMAAAVLLLALGTDRLIRSWSLRSLRTAGDRLAAGKDRLSEGVTPNGTHLSVDPGGEVHLMAKGARERVWVDRGSARFHVPRLPSGQRFEVETDQVRVVVHGTRFTVQTTPQRTAVSVSEGVVEVIPRGANRPAHLLTGGQSVDVPSDTLLRSQLSARCDELLAAGAWDEALRMLDGLLATAPPPELEGAARARRALALSATGAHEDAVAEYDRALGLSPAGQAPVWADNAAAERAALLERMGLHEPAARAWRDYRVRFPTGIHSSMAGERQP